MAFPLKKRKVSGFSFGEKTWYTAHHLGTDYAGKIGDVVRAPFDGEVIKQLNGVQGGLTVWFRPRIDAVVMRFMHLSKYGKKGKVKEGDIIGYVGNTGSATTGAHLHLDISFKDVNIKDFNNFIDPEEYQWEIPAIPAKSPDPQMPVADTISQDSKIAQEPPLEAPQVSEPTPRVETPPEAKFEPYEPSSTLNPVSAPNNSTVNPECIQTYPVSTQPDPQCIQNEPKPKPTFWQALLTFLEGLLK